MKGTRDQRSLTLCPLSNTSEVGLAVCKCHDLLQRSVPLRIRIIYVLFCLLCPIHASSTETLKADGYHGIWFELGQKTKHGDKYSGGLGTYTTSHVPIAIYAPAVNKTFFVYGGTIPGKRHLLIMASYYDHATGTVPRPIIVHDKKGVNDPHDNAALSLDDKGHLWVFVSGRANGRPGFIYRSVKPYDLGEFELIKSGIMTYPQPWFAEGEGFCFLFTMYTKGRELYWMRSSDGTQWDEPKKLAGMGGHYQTTSQRGKEIITAFNYHPGGSVDKRTNLYLLRTPDMGKTWTNAAGEVVETPLTDKASTAAMVHDYEAEKRLVYIQDVNFDSHGQPVILYVVSSDFKPGPLESPRTWHTAQWKAKEKKWSINEVTTSTHNYDVSAFYIEKDNTWRIIGPSEPGPQIWGTGGEMVMWTSNDEGANWKKDKQLTSNSPRNHSYARRPVNARPDFYALWADGDADKLSESHLYFTTKDGDVYRLPYTMKEEKAKPEKVEVD